MSPFPAQLFPNLDMPHAPAGSDAQVVLGRDLLLNIAHRDGGPNGGRDHFTGQATAVEVFDAGFNYIARIASFRNASAALDALPALIALARALYPDHT